MTDKTKLRDQLFNGATALCFIFGGVIWGNQALQNTKEHDRFMKRMDAAEERIHEHAIQLAVIGSKDATESKGL